MLPKKPMKVITQVLTRTTGADEAATQKALGTAFLVGRGIFMSANHVLGVIPDTGTEMAVIHVDGTLLTTYAVEVIHQDSFHDIAVARAPEWPDEGWLPIAPTDDLTVNTDVVSVEYSATHTRILPNGQRVVD